MNVIYKLFGDEQSLAIAERWQLRKSILGISDELAFSKMIFGFFENGVTPYRIEQRDSKACSQLEFFASSLSAKMFCENITKFLNTEQSKEIDPSTLELLIKFIESSENGQDQASLVDLARSEDIRYIWLAKTGDSSVLKLGAEFTAEDNHIDDLVSHTLDRIESLKLGEAASFLIGSVTHDTQMTVHQTQTGVYEITHCDTADFPTLKMYSFSSKEILDSNFWKQIYLKKLRNKGDSHSFVKTEDTKLKISTISNQKHNTCHIKSQIGILKAFIVYRSKLSNNQAILEWKKFKMLFGDFLLQETIQDKSLKQICQISHKKHKKNCERASIFYQCSIEGKYEETVQAYIHLFNLLGLGKIFYSENTLVNLLGMHKQFEGLHRFPLTLDQFEHICGEVDNPCVKYSLDLFIKTTSEKQAIAEKQLLEDINNHFHPNLFSNLKNFMLSFEDTSLTENEKLIATLIRDGEPVARTLKQLQDFLTIFENHPELLVDLQNKKMISDTLIQGIQAGCLEQIDAIFSKLPLEDQEWFSSKALKPIKISGSLLPDFVEEYFFENPRSFCANINGYSKFPIFTGILTKAIRKLNFSSIFKLCDYAKDKGWDFFGEKFNFEMRIKVSFMSSEQIASLKKTVSQLDPSHKVAILMKNIFSAMNK